MAVRSLSSVLKTLALCDQIARSPTPVRLSALAQKNGEGRATVYQRLKTLVDAGWVEQSGDAQFRLSLRFQILANAAMEQANLGVRVGDLLHDMVNESGETASLSVLEGHEAVIVRRAETQHLLRADLRVGARLALATTASGIALAAHAPEGLLERLRQQGVALPDADLVAEIRAAGFVTNERSHDTTVAAVAAPVIDGSGYAVAAVTLSGPTSRFDVDTCAQIVMRAARLISSQLGGKD